MSTASIVVDLPNTPLGEVLLSLLTDRGLHPKRGIAVPAEGEVVIARALSQSPTPEETVDLAKQIEERVAKSQYTVLYLPHKTPSQQHRQEELAATWACLRAYGAIVTDDPDVWLECVVLLSAYGLPPGPRLAIVAPNNTWLAASASAQQRRAEHSGARAPVATADTKDLAPTDVVLVDANVWSDESSTMLIPVVPRPTLLGGKPALVGLRHALCAVNETATGGLRVLAGTGPAKLGCPFDDIDTDRVARQLDKAQKRLGDHECKVLLASYGVSITRQAVATTPSSATRIAKKAGYPVEVKPWGSHQPSERQGCIVQLAETAAEVRRSFSSVCISGDCEAVIIRERPPQGRELFLRITEIPPMGLVALLYVNPNDEPLAALAPLHPMDADALAQRVVSSRSDDSELDWKALAELLIRTSHLVADTNELVELELSRIVLSSRDVGAVVVDANATLKV